MHTYLLIILSLLLVCLRSFCSITTQPNTLINVFVCQFVKNSVTSENDEVMMLWNRKHFNLWLGFHHVWVSSSIFKFRFRISEGSAYRKSSRKYSYWTHNKFLVVHRVWFSWLHTFGKDLGSRGLINLTTRFYDAIIFVYIRWFVISAQSNDVLSSTWTEHSPTVSNVSRITNLAHNQNNYRTRAWSFNDSPLSSGFVLFLTDF